MKKTAGRLLSLILGFLCFGAAAGAWGKTVVIDAGHGGIDRGGIPRQRFQEKIATLDIAQRVRSKLESAGYRTVMTRTGDVFVGLPARCAIANAQRGAVFVSIHTNSDPRGTGIGIETYYLSRQSARLAAGVHREVVRTAGTPDRGIRTRRLYVLRHNSLPAILVEVGFLTNAVEGPRIANSSSYRDQLAAAIVRGIRAAY